MINMKHKDGRFKLRFGRDLFLLTPKQATLSKGGVYLGYFNQDGDFFPDTLQSIPITILMKASKHVVEKFPVKLVNGNIPAGVECPYVHKCEWADTCGKDGKEFSCDAARAFSVMEEIIVS
jgi:hypothetical protein